MLSTSLFVSWNKLMDGISSLIRLLRGSAFWLVVVWTMWIGYQIGKEAKTNWFSNNLQQESTILESKIADNHSQQMTRNQND